MSNFKGRLFGPVDLPDSNKSTISDISHGAAGNMKKECGFLLSRHSKGDFRDLGILFVSRSATLTKQLFNIFAIAVESFIKFQLVF